MALLGYLLITRCSSWGTDIWNCTYVRQRSTGKLSSGKLSWKFYLDLVGKQLHTYEQGTHFLQLYVQEIRLHLYSSKEKRLHAKTFLAYGFKVQLQNRWNLWTRYLFILFLMRGINYSAVISCYNSFSQSLSSWDFQPSLSPCLQKIS